MGDNIIDNKIRARKISSIQSIDETHILEEYTLQDLSEYIYLLLSYNKEGSDPLSMKLSLQRLSNELKEIPGKIEDNVLSNQIIKILQNDINFKSSLINILNGNDESYVFRPDNNITNDNIYIFGYAKEDSDILLKDENDNVYGINTAANMPNYIVNTTGTIPIKDDYKPNAFYIKNHNNKFENYSFIWDDSVLEGNIWIFVPLNFYDINSNSFKDNNDHLWKICNSLNLLPIEPVKTVITTDEYGVLGHPYVLFCYSTNGAIGKAYFKKII